MLQTILLNLLLGVVGILFVTLLESKKFIFDSTTPKWNLSIFVSENWQKWIILGLFVLIAAVLASVNLEALKVFKLYLGIDLIDSPGGFFTFGIVLSTVLKK